MRDRNDLPVAGASVTFTINGGNAAFAGGTQTFTVATNAAGRATASALSPLSAGQRADHVSAAAQGDTTTAAITRTNFLTVAEATAAGAAVASSG